MARRWILALTLAGLVGLALAALRRDEPRSVPAGWPVNVGHRGASARYPENTLASFRSAVEAGAGGIELDVRLTRDEKAVVMHDATVDRTTDGSGPVAARTLSEIRRLNAGGRDGYRGHLLVPTLAEVLEEFPGVAVNLEIKDADLPGAEGIILRELEGAGASGRVLVVSAHHAVIRKFRKIAGQGVPTGASRFEIGTFFLLSALRLEGLARPAYAALQVPVRYGALRIVTPRFLAAAHSRGVRVDVWTINEPAEMDALLELGVDAVMTDRPETLADVLQRRAAGR